MTEPITNRIKILEGAEVNYVRFSQQIDINFIFGHPHNWKYANLQIEVPFQFSDRTGSHFIDQENLDSLESIIKLLRTKVTGIELEQNNILLISFNDEYSITLKPVKGREAWNLSGDDLHDIIA